MIKQICKYFALCMFGMVALASYPKCAHAVDLITLRIAATIALEAGNDKTSSRVPMENVAKVIQERHKSQNGQASWSEVLYGGKDWFQKSRGLASKNADELNKFGLGKAGKGNWEYALSLAQQVKGHGLAQLKGTSGGKTLVANGFMRNYTGTLGPKLFRDNSGHDFFNTDLGSIHASAFLDQPCLEWKVLRGKRRCVRRELRGLSDNSPRQSHDWDNTMVEGYIKRGANGNYTPTVTNDGEGSNTSSTNAGGGNGASDSSVKKTYKASKGREKAKQKCGMTAIQKSYDTDNDTCWYCDVVVTMTNAYFKAAGSALPSSIALGKIILKWGFLIWLAYYILQQVSSFAPLTISKILQDILVMGFKVALATLAVDAANSVIVDFYVNPIGELGTDYGMAIYDQLTPEVKTYQSHEDGGGGSSSMNGGEDFSGNGGGGVQ